MWVHLTPLRESLEHYLSFIVWAVWDFVVTASEKRSIWGHLNAFEAFGIIKALPGQGRAPRVISEPIWALRCYSAPAGFRNGPA